MYWLYVLIYIVRNACQNFLLNPDSKSLSHKDFFKVILLLVSTYPFLFNLFFIFFRLFPCRFCMVYFFIWVCHPWRACRCVHVSWYFSCLQNTNQIICFWDMYRSAEFTDLPSSSCSVLLYCGLWKLSRLYP